MQKIIM